MEDVLIIGGGFAGLAAGVALSAAGRRVRLLEQKPHLGGRAYSFRDPTTGTVVDNGQHILMGCYHSTVRFLKEIGTLDRFSFQPRFNVRFLDPPGRLSELACPHLAAPWHVLLGVFRSNSFTLREKLEVFRLGRAFRSRWLRHNDSRSQSSESTLTVDEWLSRLGQSERLRRNFWDLLCIAALNEDPRIAAAGLFEQVLRLALFTSAADSCIGLARCGLSECYTDAAAAFIIARQGQLETGRSVASLLISDGPGRVRIPDLDGTGHPAERALPKLGVCQGVKLADGGEIRSQIVLSAMPSFQLVRILPPVLLRTEPFFGNLLSLRPAPIISINLWFDRSITDVDFVGLRGTTIQWLFNKSRILERPFLSTPDSGLQTPNSSLHSGAGTPDSELFHISLVISGAHEHIGRPKDELLSVALRELRELLPEARHAKLMHSMIIKERFATFSPSVGTEALRPPATTPLQSFYLAGDWTATGLPATIEGAVKSGYTAAGVILKTGSTKESTGTTEKIKH